MRAANADVRANDKVKIRRGPHTGQRAMVEKVASRSIYVRISKSQRLVMVKRDAISNFSAAARKAWKTMPRRNVGRPKGHTVDRVSVTLRLDRVLWDRFRTLEAAGAISDRSDFVEAALARRLARLEGS